MFSVKSRALFINFLSLAAVTIFASQPWFQFSMQLDGESMALSNFDGFTTYPFLLPVIAVVASSLVVGALSAIKVNRISLWLNVLFTSILTLALLLNLITKNVSGLASQLETATGIAANHGAVAAESTILWPAMACLVALVGLTWSISMSALKSQKWLSVSRSSVGKKQKSTKDPIQLWDSQR